MRQPPAPAATRTGRRTSPEPEPYRPWRRQDQDGPFPSMRHPRPKASPWFSAPFRTWSPGRPRRQMQYPAARRCHVRSRPCPNASIRRLRIAPWKLSRRHLSPGKTNSRNWSPPTLNCSTESRFVPGTPGAGSSSGARRALRSPLASRPDGPSTTSSSIRTLAELKRGSNPEVRRGIVGQLLEYAAHASETWTATELREAFEGAAEARGREPRDELARLLQSDGEPDADGFWEDVSTNLAAKTPAPAVRR